MKVRNIGFRLHLRTVYQLAPLIRRPEPDWGVPAETCYDLFSPYT